MTRTRRATASLAVVALGAGLAASPARAAVDPLQLRFRATIRGGLASAATCVNHADPADGGPTGGILRLTGMPADASVLEAWLYWSVLSDLSPVPPGAPQLDGMPIVPIPQGELLETPCFPDQDYTGAFRADVAAIVRGNGDYALTGLIGDGTHSGVTLTEGATLMVAWTAPSAGDATIAWYDGLDVASGDFAPTRQTMTGFTMPPAGTALLVAAIGNGQWFGPDDVRLEGEYLAMLDPSAASGSLCPGAQAGLYDHTRIDVTPALAPGATSATLELVATGDCYSLAACAIVVAPRCSTAEPSALDLVPGAAPLRVRREPPATHRLTWENVGPTQLWRGTIGSWYDHAAIACDVPGATASETGVPGNLYYLAAGCGPSASGGRDSFGVERPTALQASGVGCP